MTRAAARWCAFVCAFVLFAGVASDLVRMPLQVSDSLEEIIDAQQSPSAWSSFTTAFGDAAYLRPVRVAETKVLFDLSRGRYFVAYKTFHVLLLLAAFVLLVRAMRVTTAADGAAAIFALTAFTGLHTFLATVKEAYPINHFLQVVVLCLAALNLVQAEPRRWTGAAAAAVFVAACLTLESGVLAWVILAAGYAVGFRGVSPRAIAGITLLLAAYLWLRFGWLGREAAGMQAASGFLLERLEPGAIQERFAGRMLWFHAYNVVASALSVLFSEPRGGVWVLARSWLASDVAPRVWINIVTSTATTGVIAFAAAQRLREGTRAPLSNGDRLLLLFGVVLAGNAVTSFGYAKDEIMSVAGTFYALAAFAAIRHVLTARQGRAAAVALGAVLLVAAAGWTVRSVGVHHVLRTQAFNHRNDWAGVVEWLEARDRWPSDPRARALVTTLQAEALAMPVTNPWFMSRWADRVFDADY